MNARWSGWIIAVALSVSGGAAWADAVDLAGEPKPFGPGALAVLPNLMRHDGVAAFANPETAAALADPASVARTGWTDGVEARLRAGIGLDENVWRDALAGRGCRFSQWRDLAEWAVAEAVRAVQPLAGLAASCGGTACLPPDGERFEVAAAILGLPGGDHAARDAAPPFLAVAEQLAACGRGLPPPRPGRWDTPWGQVVFLGAQDDVIAPEPGVVMVLDAGGNDVWRLPPPLPGGFLLAVDLGGNDVWEGDATARLAALAILDLAGDDRYVSAQGGQGAALGGVSLQVDAGGDDSYRAGAGAQASAQAGVAVLVDGGGDDSYQAGARSQAFAGPGGTAILWDLGGADRYRADGPADRLARGGAMSWAQGVGTGRREGLGGGTAILRDDGGDDLYQAGMFAQGAGYYDGIGILADHGGRDVYHAARYGQGIGLHRGIGVLADGGGDDRYELTVGVGQGMGLDVAVGVLADGGGDDSYRAATLAQGSSTANGIGVLWDGGGRDRFHLDGDGWGRDHMARGLPGLAFLLGTDDADVFIPASGPRNREPAQPDPTGVHACPAWPTDAAPAADWLAAVRGSWPGNGSGPAELAAAAHLAAALPDNLEAMLAAVPGDDFGAAFTLREVVRCWLAQAPEAARRRAGEQAIAHLADHPDHLPWVAGFVLGQAGLGRAGLAPGRMLAGAELLAANPSCRARAAGLRLLRGVMPGHALVLGARHDPCLEARAAVVDGWPLP